jgi:acylpyruvate hydrolase
MRFAMYRATGGAQAVAASTDGKDYFGISENHPLWPGDLDQLMRDGRLTSAGPVILEGNRIDLDDVELLPPLRRSEKIICVGLNYAGHSMESGFQAPGYPTLFARFSSSIVGHGAPIVRPLLSKQLDYEGELVAIVGRGGRYIPRQSALEHVVGYSIFNDASVRDFQFKTPQWTVGKNFDATGPFGPILVTADELPEGCRGLKIETRLNGKVVQSGSIDELVFDVASLVSIISDAITLSAGDLIVTGTPSGIAAARTPQFWMKPGDVCEVEVERIGILRNPIMDESEYGHSKMQPWRK